MIFPRKSRMCEKCNRIGHIEKECIQDSDTVISENPDVILASVPRENILFVTNEHRDTLFSE